MPAKILLTGLCFYLMPLYVTSMDGSQAMAGRGSQNSAKINTPGHKDRGRREGKGLFRRSLATQLNNNVPLECGDASH